MCSRLCPQEIYVTCSSKGNLKRNNYWNNITLSFSRLLLYTRNSPVDYFPTLNWLLNAIPTVFFSFFWHLSCLNYIMVFICFLCQIQIWIVSWYLPTSNQIIRDLHGKKTVSHIMWRTTKEHEKGDKKTGREIITIFKYLKGCWVGGKKLSVSVTWDQS